MELLKEYKGELELIGRKGKEIVYYDRGPNTVTIWAKQATMHLLTGESFSSHGQQRSFDETTDHTTLLNTDGTLMSGEQYFSNNTDPYYSLDTRWSKSTVDASVSKGDASATDDEMKYPFFPTKMLFGTGFEYASWSVIPADYQTYYTSLGWDQATFDSNISNADNDYSNAYTGTILTKKRTMNDIYSTAISSPAVTDEDFAITGAVKTGFYTNQTTQQATYTYLDGGDRFLNKAYQGVGKPAFVYAKRTSRYFEDGSEIQLSVDSNIENKITYSVVLPEQSGGSAGVFYPYNGYVIKEAGLFCDAKFVLFNTNPDGVPANEDTTTELDNFNSMPYGLMFAKRYVAPFTKTADVSLTARWTLYL